MSFAKIRSPSIDPLTGDKVLPLRFWDTNDVFLKLALDFTFRFDDVLDPEKLRLSLEHLVTIGNWHQIGARYKKNVSDCKGSKSDNSDLSADRSDRQLERSRFIYPSVMMRRSRRLYGLTTTGSRASLRTSLRGDCLNMPKPCVPRFTRMQVPSRVSWHAPVDQQSWSSGSNKDTRAYQSTWFPSPMRLW
jgi:hypothetical protein